VLEVNGDDLIPGVFVEVAEPTIVPPGEVLPGP